MFYITYMQVLKRIEVKELLLTSFVFEITDTYDSLRPSKLSVN